MRTRWFALALALATALCGPARTGRASEPISEAAELYQQGSSAFARGDYRIAGVAFEAACAKAPRSQTALSAAFAWEAAADDPRSADNFALALALGALSTDEAAEATSKLATLEKRLGLLTLRADGGTVTVAHLERRPLPVSVHVQPGRHDVVFTNPSGETWKESLVIAPGEQRDLERPAPSLLSRGVRPPRPREPGAPVRTTPGSTGQRALGLTFVGLAVGATAATGILGGLTLAARTDYEDSEYTDRALYERGTTLRTWTNVSLGLAAGFSILGTIILVAIPPDSPEAPTISADEGGLVVHFQ